MNRQQRIREGMERILKIKEMTKATRDTILEMQLKFLKSEGMVLRGESLGASHPQFARYFTFQELI